MCKQLPVVLTGPLAGSILVREWGQSTALIYTDVVNRVKSSEDVIHTGLTRTGEEFPRIVVLKKEHIENIWWDRTGDVDYEEKIRIVDIQR